MSKRYAIIFAAIILVATAAYLRWPLALGVMFAQETVSRFRSADLHRETFEKVIRPTADWVREFRKREGRFPTTDEMEAHTKTFPQSAYTWVGIYDTPPSDISHRWQTGVDFILISHVGDWNLFYHSWDGKESKYWTD